jgi:hypothetical protein
MGRTRYRRVAVVGTRPPDPSRRDSCPQWAWDHIVADVRRTLEAVLAKHGHFVLVSGGARGVDSLGEDFARAKRMSRIIHEPDYQDPKLTPVAALMTRNQWIVDDCDVMLAWPKPGRQGGTENAIARMMKKDPTACYVREPWAGKEPK